MFRSRCSAAANGFAQLACIAVSFDAAWAQGVEQRGAAEVSFVGSQASYSSTARLSTSGLSFTFSQYWPKAGLLEGSAEGFMNQGALRAGTDYLRLSDLRWGGERVALTWGDFSVDPYPLGLPFLNIAVPRIEANGFHLETVGKKHVYRVFVGRGSLLAGARIPLRYRSGQNVAGAEASWDLTNSLSISGRVVDFGRQDPNALRGITSGFGANSSLPAALSVTSDLLWKPRSEFKAFAEASYSAFQGAYETGPKPGGIAGLWWESSRWKWHTNYLRQPASYLPVAGYIVDARSGYFADVSFAVHPRLDIYGAASLQYLDTAQILGGLQYRQVSNTVGTTARLAWHTDLSAQYTDLAMRSTGNADQHGKFTTVSLAKALKRQTLRLSVRQLSITGQTGATRQNSLELGDDVRVGRFTLSGASRWERDALDFRGGVQGNFKQLTVYAQVEAGSDLASKTLFATTATRSNSFGLQYRIGRFWSVSADAWNSRVLVNLNEDTVALLAASGQLTPILANQQQWSAFLRVSRRLSWGGANYSRSDIAGIANRATPFVGALGGVIVVDHPGKGPAPAAGVAILLDDYRTASSDLFGRYRFEDVPTGVHRVSIDPRHLPVDFADGDYRIETANVELHRTARADFSIRAAAVMEGHVEAPKGVRLSEVVVRVEPGGRYTFVDDQGVFRMEGVPEGDYQVRVDTAGSGESIAPVAVQSIALRAEEPASFRFELTRAVKELPIRSLPVGSSN